MTIDYLAHLRAESARFRQVLTNTDPSAPVPSCPQWTASDLLWHLAEVQLFWATIVRDRLTDPKAAGVQVERPSDYAALLALYRQASGALVDALASTADDVSVWTWFDADQGVGFVRRRQAHEALIHRLDAELTAGTVTDIDVELATDGVAEVLEWMYGGAPDWSTHENDGAAGQLITTDTDRHWLVQIGHWSGTSPNTGKTYTAEPTLTIVAEGEPGVTISPTFTISAAAPDLDAWLWNRPTRSDISREGDSAQLEAVIKTGVQ